ncbi:hypothetical protein BH23CHL3_BH23CHL3_11480 [soil metagenome]
MTRFRAHASHDDDRNPKDALDDALEALVRGDRKGIDALDPEMRATVDQMYRWADESGFRNEPLPITPRRAWGGVRWRSAVSVVAAALLVGVILAATFLIVNLAQNDSAPESFYGSGGEDMVNGNGDVHLTQGEYARTIYAAFGDYQWPGDYTPAVDDIVNYVSTAEEREDSTAEYPYGPEPGHNVVGFWHSCAWYRAWIDAYQSGDSELEAEALDMITNVVPDHFDSDESTHEHTEKIAAASLCDPSLVARFIEGGCGNLPLVNNSEGGGGVLEDEQLGARIGDLDLVNDGNCFDVGPSGEIPPCNPGTPTTPED